MVERENSLSLLLYKKQHSSGEKFKTDVAWGEIEKYRLAGQLHLYAKQNFSPYPRAGLGAGDTRGIANKNLHDFLNIIYIIYNITNSERHLSFYVTTSYEIKFFEAWIIIYHI